MIKNDKQLGKQLLSNAKQTNKSKSSLKKTKPETHVRLRKDIDSDINVQVFEHWLDNLDSASRESFSAFAEETFSPIQVYLYAKFLGYESSIIAVDHWVAAAYPKPDHYHRLHHAHYLSSNRLHI